MVRMYNILNMDFEALFTDIGKLIEDCQKDINEGVSFTPEKINAIRYSIADLIALTELNDDTNAYRNSAIVTLKNFIGTNIELTHDVPDFISKYAIKEP
jgi:hypothetical protein